MRSRTKSEKLTDQMLLLLLVHRARSSNYSYGRTHIIKAAFKMALALRGNIAAPNYHFYRWDYGPFSREVYSDLRTLADAGIISEDQPTEEGESLLMSCLPALRQAPLWVDALDALHESVDDIVRKTYKDASAWSHGMKIRPTGSQDTVLIHDMRKGDTILNPRDETAFGLDLPDDVAEQLLYSLSLSSDDVAQMHVPAGSGTSELFV